MQRTFRRADRRNTKKGEISSENEAGGEKPKMHKIAEDVYLYAYR
jgi:hypothetical protein